MARRHEAKGQTKGAGREGFALMGILVAIAVIAILAGVLGPMAYRQMMEGRLENTRQEMLAIADALQRFFTDTGRYPSEAEGLDALVSNPGAAGWQGPYLVGQRWASSEELNRDGFGEPYVYDADPDVSPPADIAILLVSGGPDNSVTSGTLDGTWSLLAPGNDLQIKIEADAFNLDKVGQARGELQALSDAAKAFFEDNAEFPTDLADLAATYQDEGFAGAAFTDPWLRPYLLTVDNGAVPPTLQLFSLGPNGTDDGIAGDDIRLDVDSVVPGRRKTFHMIRTAQTAVTHRSHIALTGDWDADFSGFGLSPAFQFDGWGKLLEEAVSTRTILSAGPDGDYYTPLDNIPRGVVPDDIAAGPAIELVAGTQQVTGSNCYDVTFDVINTSSELVSISSLQLSWPSPTAYYKSIRINGSPVASSFIFKYASGATTSLYSSIDLAPGQTINIAYEKFTKYIVTNLFPVNMGGAYLTLEFSDGSVVEVPLPSC